MFMHATGPLNGPTPGTGPRARDPLAMAWHGVAMRLDAARTVLDELKRWATQRRAGPASGLRARARRPFLWLVTTLRISLHAMKDLAEQTSPMGPHPYEEFAA